MRTYLPLILATFSIFVVSIIGSTLDEIEAEIAKLELAGAIRIFNLPHDSSYSFQQDFIDPFTGKVETLTYNTTVREILNGFTSPLTEPIFDSPFPTDPLQKRADPNFGVVCETSLASPLVTDVVKVLVDMNFSMLGNCCRLITGGSGCQTLETHGEGAVGLCGPWMRCVPCKRVIDFVLTLIDACKYKDAKHNRIVVGGRFMLGDFGRHPWGGYLTVYHT